MDNIVRVFVDGAITVSLLEAELKEVGINPIVKNNRRSGAIAGFGGGTETSVELYVSQSELEKAEIVINDFKKRQQETKL